MYVYIHIRKGKEYQNLSTIKHLIKYSTIKHKYDVTFDIISPMEMI